MALEDFEISYARHYVTSNEKESLYVWDVSDTLILEIRKSKDKGIRLFEVKESYRKLFYNEIYKTDLLDALGIKYKLKRYLNKLWYNLSEEDFIKIKLYYKFLGILEERE